MITSSMPWNNGSDVAANAFDGDVSTFFDGLEEGYIRVDLGGEYLIGKVGYAPRSGYESRLSGTFYGSLDGRTWYEIYQIKSAPSSMKETDYTEFSTVGRFAMSNMKISMTAPIFPRWYCMQLRGFPQHL